MTHIGAQLKDHWRNAQGYQKLLYSTGALLLVSAVFHTAVLVVTGGSLHGDVSFRKAITFGEAFGLTAISLAWFLTFLPIRRVLWWTCTGIYVVATFAEVFLTTMQVWRGVPSHFNNGTTFDALVFALMGRSISRHIPLLAGILIGTLFFSNARPLFRWGATAGMHLFCLCAGNVV